MATIEELVESERPRLAKRAWAIFNDEKNKALAAELANVDHTSLRTLLTAFDHACCLEEVCLVLRYKGGRDGARMTANLVQALLKQFEEVAVAVGDRVAATDADRAKAKLVAGLFTFVIMEHKWQCEFARASQPAGDGRRPGR